MSPEDWPEGYGRRILPDVDSTMLEAARVAPGLSGPEWIMALQQTAARGRRGRAWAMPPGNFAATLALPVGTDAAQAALRSFSAALALHDAFSDATGRPDGFALKWPNDVLLHGGKVAGILLETLPGGWLSIGIGVNLAAAPARDELQPGALPPVALLAETGLRIAPEAFLTLLARAFAGWEARLRAEGFAPVRAEWLRRAARLGQEITARTGSRELTGRFESIDASGCLILATPTTRHTIAAAEVFF
ncbi:biotin--[acetyl-CoA-carboxylase] ligase [Frigidibacter sp. ROC022]|uniref:biotin--[acetyl-CoA-carboxylase] ligase n=1 Tax=Frigidibacter sp. ROC022 TaxID=2971796 RepID=UPI00215AAFBE|nr:biotin--[acetyl-CoA-carboxylase] ligase [Frigidibacter sp. ROC022]MCR8723291.1 biotin--[acetyl-CoA-carboxylase] ligase [Frigidibacter sp. ROC022]